MKCECGRTISRHMKGKSMKCYKGFDKDMKCRGFQYEEGKTYEEEKAELCNTGFHACEDPLDIFGYYPPADSKYHEVELEEITEERSEEDTKICGRRITIGAEIGIPGIVKAHVEYVKENVKKAVEAGDAKAVAVGDEEAASAGDSGSASAGDSGSASAGDRGSASAGYRGSASAGDSGSASAGYSGSASAGWQVTAFSPDAVEMERTFAICCPQHIVLLPDDGGMLCAWQNRYGDALSLVKELGEPVGEMPDGVQEELRRGKAFDSLGALEKWLEGAGS